MTDLEYLGLQLVANADHAFESGGKRLQEWRAAAKRYSEDYLAKMQQE